MKKMMDRISLVIEKEAERDAAQKKKRREE